MATVDHNWFKSKLAIKGESQNALARHLGIDPGALSKTFRGERVMTMSEAARISKFLNVPVQEVMAHAGIYEAVPSRSANDVPLIGNVDPAQFTVTLTEKAGDKHIPTVPCPVLDLEGEVVAIRCRSLAGGMSAFDGWIYYFRPSEVVDPEAIARVSVCQIAPDGPILLRFVKRGYTAGRYTLTHPTAHDEPAMEDVELAWASPVLWIRSS